MSAPSDRPRSKRAPFEIQEPGTAKLLRWREGKGATPLWQQQTREGPGPSDLRPDLGFGLLETDAIRLRVSETHQTFRIPPAKHELSSINIREQLQPSASSEAPHKQRKRGLKATKERHRKWKTRAFREEKTM